MSMNNDSNASDSDDNTDGSMELPPIPVSASKSLTSIGFSRELDDELVSNTTPNQPLIFDNQQPMIAGEDQSLQLQISCENHEILKDIVCLIIKCPDHQTIALQRILDYYYYFPSIQLPLSSSSMNQSLTETIRSLLDIVIVDPHRRSSVKFRLIKIDRIKVPKLRRYINRWMFEGYYLSDNLCICNGNWNPMDLNFQQQQLGDQPILWLPLNQLSSMINLSIWGGELFDYFNQKLFDHQTVFNEYDYEDIIDRVLADHSLTTLKTLDGSNSNENTKDNAQLAPLESIRKSAEYLYNEYTNQCYPSLSMTFASFNILLNKLDWFIGTWYKDNRLQLFRRMDKQSLGYVRYDDLLACVLRLSSSDNQSNVINNNDDESISLKNCNYNPYFKEIEQKFNCRCKPSTNGQRLMDEQLYYDRCNHCLRSLFRNNGQNNDQINNNKFKLSSLLIQLNRMGDIKRLQRLKSSANARCNRASNTSDSKANNGTGNNGVNDGDEPIAIRFVDDIQQSNIFIMANNFINRFMMMYHHQNRGNNGQLNDHKSLYFTDGQILMKQVEILLKFSKNLFTNYQSMIIEIDCHQSLCIIGYLQSSINDLCSLTEKLFSKFPFIQSEPLIFMGNFLPKSLPPLTLNDTLNKEYYCFICLLCMKILMPTKIHLLVGENELNLLMMNQPNINDCDNNIKGYGLDRIENLIIDILNLLPYGCLIDHRLFVSSLPLDTSLIADNQPSWPSLSMNQLKILTNWSRLPSPANNLNEIYYNYNIYDHEDYYSRIFDHRYSSIYENLFDQWLLSQQSTGEHDPKSMKSLDNIKQAQREKQLLEFVRKNRLFSLIQASTSSNDDHHRGNRRPNGPKGNGGRLKNDETDFKGVNDDDNDDEDDDDDGYQFPINNNYDIIQINRSSSSSSNRLPTILYLDRNRLRFICFE